MLYLVIILIGLGIIVAMFTVLTRKGGDEEDVLVGQADTCATCDGTNTQCEQECMMEAATKEIEYFDDEELDAFRQRPADGYSDEEAEMFREVMYSMRLNYDFPEVGKHLTANETITFGTHKLRVLTTPGHSRGSICFVCDAEKVVFTGDTLFRMSVGRTDFEGGSTQQIIDSLHRLAKLPDDMVVLPGHGPQSTIGDEKKFNPYMRMGRSM